MATRGQNSDIANVSDVSYYYFAPIVQPSIRSDGVFESTHRLLLTDRNYKDYQLNKRPKLKAEYTKIANKLVEVLTNSSAVFVQDNITAQEIRDWVAQSSDKILEQIEEIEGIIEKYQDFNGAANKTVAYVLFNIQTVVHCKYTNERIKELYIQIDPSRRAAFNATGWTPGFKHMYYRFERLSKVGVSTLQSNS